MFESLSQHSEKGWCNWLLEIIENNKHVFGKESVGLDSSHYLIRFSSEKYDWSLVCGDKKIKINHGYCSSLYSAGTITSTSLIDCASNILKEQKWVASPVDSVATSFHSLVFQEGKNDEHYI